MNKNRGLLSCVFIFCGTFSDCFSKKDESKNENKLEINKTNSSQEPSENQGTPFFDENKVKKEKN